MKVLGHFTHQSIFGLRGTSTFCPRGVLLVMEVFQQKNSDRKLLRYVKVLNFFKSLSTFSCVKMLSQFHIYYSRKELKQLDPEIFSNIWDISTENHNKFSWIIFRAKLFYNFSRIYFGTNVPKNSDKKNLSYVKTARFSHKISIVKMTRHSQNISSGKIL